MMFWDTSALALLVVQQPGSKDARHLYRLDPTVSVWALTHVEVTSTVRRLSRAGGLSPEQLEDALTRHARLFKRVNEIDALHEVRERAERCLALHPLKAADALQLGAALLLTDDKPRKRPFVAVDGVLATAARNEGFDVRMPRE